LIKVVVGRWRKRADWVTWLYVALHDEFDQLCKIGLEISSEVLLILARSLVINSTYVLFNVGYLDPLDRVPILENLNPQWIQSFQDNHNILN
jgi:hypothetical protein